MSWRKKWPSLKKIKQKLKTWECRIGKQQKSCYDVIKATFKKKKTIKETVISNFCKDWFVQVSTKSVQNVWNHRPVQTHASTQIQTHRQGSPWDNIFSFETTEYRNILSILLRQQSMKNRNAYLSQTEYNGKYKNDPNQTIHWGPVEKAKLE